MRGKTGPRIESPILDRQFETVLKISNELRMHSVIGKTRPLTSTAQARFSALMVSAMTLLLIAGFSACGGGGSAPPPPASNPLPGLSSISPESTAAGGDAFTLTINGQNFVSSSGVQWNGVGLTTTFISSTHLSAFVPASRIAASGLEQITVFNPAPGGGTSTALVFTVNNPVPTITATSPSGTVAGGPGFTLTLLGANFVPTSSVLWNGSGRSVNFVSSMQLNVEISESDITSAGIAQLTVSNPGPGGGTSRAFAFPIESPMPLAILTSRLPDSAGGKDYYFIPLATGGVPPLSWSLASGSSLPLALSIDTTTQDSAGLISGTLGAVGTDTTYNLTLQVTDSATSPHVVTRDLSLTVHGVSLGRNDACTAGTTAGTTQISNGRLRASISPYGDIDVYSFHGTAGSQVTIETFAGRLFLPSQDWQGSFLDSVLELLDSNCNQLTVNDDIEFGYTLDSLIQNFSLPYTGTYFIRVRDWRGDGRPDLIYDLALTGAD